MALMSVLRSVLFYIFHFRQKQNPSRLNDNKFTWLPEELIIYHILLRLSVETLLRLKSVSKSWLSLISSSEFIEIHLAKSTNDSQLTGHHLLVSSVPFALNGEPEHVSGLVKSFTSLSLYSLVNDMLIEPIEHDYLGDKLKYIVGHCKGLVCVVVVGKGNDYVLLWNPSTRISRRLPKLEYNVCRFGFGYDELTNDFKVVAIVSCNDPKCEVSIYSTKTDSWRMIGDFPFKDEPDDDGIFTNGAVHWIVRPSMQFNHPKSIVIVSLDLKTETFREILPPECGKDVYCCTLGTFGKDLSFCEFDYASARAKLWIMKKCDVQEWWTQIVTIPCTNLISLRRFYMKPIQFSVNGDVILNSESNLRLYSFKDNTDRKLLDRERGWLSGADTYVESLVSPLL